MAENTAPSSGEQTPTHSSHHLHSGRRLKKLLHPNGRRIHIAATPEEHRRLSKTLTKIEPDENYDIYIHASEEHLRAVRECHAHQEGRRKDLRAQYADAYDEFERVREELDLLSYELEHLTDFGVELDANFSKFGYNSHIRTRKPDSSAMSISSNTTLGDGEKRDWDAERKLGKSMKFWRRPVVRQYHHKGLIWRAQEVAEVYSFELFVDLLYVGIIAIIGDNAAENATSFGVLCFIITFMLAWKMWSDLTLIVSWFEIDDITQRLLVLGALTCLFGYTLNIISAFDSTWTMLISFYLASRFSLAVYLLWTGYLLPMIRGPMIWYSLTAMIPCAFWIGSVHLDYPARLGFVWSAIFLDFCLPMLIIPFLRLQGKGHSLAPFARRIAKYFDFVPAFNIEHKTERTNAFVTLVFGYSVVALLFQNRASFGINGFFGKAILGLVQAFAFNWLYFEIDGWNLHCHAIRRHYLSSIIWNLGHLPFIMGYVLASASLSRLVLATDCHDADIESLTEFYVSRSTPEVPTPLRWFYCAGLSIALVCMSIISLTHVHKEIASQRITKQTRLIARVCVAIIIACLPLARHLSSLRLIATTSSLVVLTLAVDVYGSTDGAQTFWKCRGRAEYSTACPVGISRKKIVEALKRGEKVDVASAVSAANGMSEKDGVTDMIIETEHKHV